MPLAAAEVPFRFALWLVSGLLVLAPDAKDALYFQYVPGIERIGAALDRALSGITGDLPRSASVLRKQLSQVARRHIAAGVGAAYVVALADLYEVADDFPTGQNVDNYYDWIGVVTLGMLTDAAGRLGIAYGSLEQCMGLRFDSDAAVAVRGPLDMLSQVIQRSADPEDSYLLYNCTAVEMADELSRWIVRVQPVADELTILRDTPLGSQQLLRRQLVASHDGKLSDVIATNVGGVLHHYPLLLSLIGQNVGGAVALGMVFEVVRLAHGTVRRNLTIEEIGSAMRRLEWMLPKLRSPEVAALAPSDRLALAVAEVDAWKLQEKTGGGGGGGRGALLTGGGGERGEDSFTVGGDSNSYLVQLREMLGSLAFVEACRNIEEKIDMQNYNEAIKLVFAYGYLPLIHALIGRRRPLPGHTTPVKIAEILAPKGPQCVGDMMQAALLPAVQAGAMEPTRAPPMHVVWSHIITARTDTLPYEDACYAVKAHCNNQAIPAPLAEAERFTNIERLYVCEPGIMAILKLTGKPIDAEGNFGGFLKEIYAYDKYAHAMSRTARADVMHESITTVLQENARNVQLVWNSEDPTHRIGSAVVQPGSAGKIMLDTASSAVPQNTAIVNAMRSVMEPAQAKAIGLVTEMVVPGAGDALRRGAPGTAPKLATIREGGETARGGARVAPSSAERATGARGEAGASARAVGCDYACLCELVGDEAHMGNKGRREVCSARAAERVVGPRAKDKTKWCLFTALSRGNGAYTCATPFAPGHERHDSPAHVYSIAKKKQLLMLFSVASATANSTACSPSSVVASQAWWQAPAAATSAGGVTWLSAPQFNENGGLIYVPARFGANFTLELGVPDDDAAWWFGESLEEGIRDVRDASLATAWNWTRQLFPGRSDVVATGLFEDSNGADGQVTAALVTPPDALDDGLGELRGGQRAELAPSGSTKLNCIDLFAGAGGLATGLSQAGFEIELLVESDERVAAALTRNRYEHVECAEVQAVDFTRWRGGVTLLSGGPPCQPYSEGGLRRGAADDRDGWGAALGAVAAVLPRVVLFENVRGLMSAKFESYRGSITLRLEGLGYYVAWH